MLEINQAATSFHDDVETRVVTFSRTFGPFFVERVLSTLLQPSRGAWIERVVAYWPS